MSQSLITRGYGGTAGSVAYIIRSGLNPGEAAASANLVIVYDRLNVTYTHHDYTDLPYNQSEYVNVIYTLTDRVDIP